MNAPTIPEAVPYGLALHGGAAEVADQIEQRHEQVKRGRYPREAVALFGTYGEPQLVVRLLREAATRGVRAFARAVLHGDDAHRAWLTAAAESWLAGETLPAVDGQGTKEALLARAEAAETALAEARQRVAELEALK